jgi:hypothetical protein
MGPISKCRKYSVRIDGKPQPVKMQHGRRKRVNGIVITLRTGTTRTQSMSLTRITPDTASNASSTKVPKGEMVGIS